MDDCNILLVSPPDNQITLNNNEQIGSVEFSINNYLYQNENKSNIILNNNNQKNDNIVKPSIPMIALIEQKHPTNFKKPKLNNF